MTVEVDVVLTGCRGCRRGLESLQKIGVTLRASISGTFLQTARFGYATEGALFISAQLSSGSGTDKTVVAT